MKAMILAAGLGTRLAPFTDHHPKALAMLGTRTLLEWAILYLQRSGIRDVTVNVHHFADQIEEMLRTHQGWGSNVIISDERDEVLETGGGLKNAASFLADDNPVVVMNVDVITTLELPAMVDVHKREKAAATLAVMRRTSSRYLQMDGEMRLCGWRNQRTGERKGTPGADFAFSGVQIVSQELLQGIQLEGKFSLIDVYLDAAVRGQVICGYDHSNDLFLDVGTPDTLAAAAKIVAGF